MNCDTIILLDNGHGCDTLGKQSPDGRLKEYKYTREIVQEVHKQLLYEGFNPYILVPEDIDIPLNSRVQRANKVCKNAEGNAILVSIHCDAAGSGKLWCNASGWSVFLAQNASNNSKNLAKYLKEEADLSHLKVRLLYSDKPYWVKSLAICRDTNCPAVLTENLFQDNEKDVQFLLSKEGREIITNIHVNGIIKYLNG